jgi:hypothetical protein
MHAGRTGSHHHTGKTVFFNIFLDVFLARVGAHVFIIPGNDYLGPGFSFFGERSYIHDAGDIGTAVANIYTNAFSHGTPPS